MIYSKGADRYGLARVHMSISDHMVFLYPQSNTISDAHFLQTKFEWKGASKNFKSTLEDSPFSYLFFNGLINLISSHVTHAHHKEVG
jgi:hypothetical protein